LIKDWLLYHVVNGTVNVTSAVTSSSSNKTLATLLPGYNITLSRESNPEPLSQSDRAVQTAIRSVPGAFILTGYFVNNATILGGVGASNGILYWINQVCVDAYFYFRVLILFGKVISPLDLNSTSTASATSTSKSE
jgi:uncharacterized surface protein with fasciclin (FAS1) repeats